MSRFKVRIKKKPIKAKKRLDKIDKALNGPGNVKVGLPKGSNNYPDGTSVIMVGLVQEFGSPVRNIPERSYLRSTVAGNKRKYKALMRKLAKQISEGKMTLNKALNILGLQVQSDVQDKITSISSPALKNREGNPLVDTGHLRQSITYQVED